MNKFWITIISILILYGCQSAPKNFTYHYNGRDTGLDKLIDIEGYYVSEHGCDSTFHSVYMFYPDGLFTIATAENVSSELIDCFLNGGTSTICRYPVWGTYIIDGDMIKTQAIRTEAEGFVIFRDYRILSGKGIMNVSDYVQPEFISLGYMKNYPSFENNRCSKPAQFYPAETKRRPEDCPLLKKKWFSGN